MTDSYISVLVVDDHPADIQRLRSALEADPLHTFVLSQAETLDAGMKLAGREPFDAVVIDLELPDSQGTVTFERLQPLIPQIPIIVWSENSDEKNAIEAVQAGAQDYLVKNLAGFTMAGRIIYHIVKCQKLRKSGQVSVARFPTSTTNMSVYRQTENIVRLWAAAFENCAHGIAIGLPDTNQILTCNPAFASLQGRTIDEITDMPILSMYTPQDHDHIKHAIAEADRVGNVRYEAHMVRKDGSTYPVQMDVVSVRDEDGNLIYRVATQQDITKRKQAETALIENERRFRALIENAPGAITLLGADGRLTYVSSSTRRVMGYRLEEVLGEDPAAFTHPDDLPALLTLLTDLMQHPGSVRTTRYRFRHQDGSWRWVESTISNLLHEPGVNGIAFNFQDITERQQEESLRMANAELARAARAKDEFLANMSHELRTPLNAILAFNETLLEKIYGPLNIRQHEALHHIEDSAQHLLALINDILDLSKVEAGRLDLQIEPVFVADICQASLQFVKELALRKSLRLDFHLNDQQAIVAADPKRLKQMLVNLLSNAVKFTPDKGAVRLDVEANLVEGVIRFSVRDTGIGITPDGLAQLFQPFSQLDSSLSRQYEGTGLGLALVRHLVELHGGSITVESEVGQGSTFSIALPYQPPKPAALRSAATGSGDFLARHDGVHATPVSMPRPAPALTGAQVLLAEDNEANIEAIRMYLQSRGYQVVVAHNGREALERVGEFCPAIILMDIQMPEMDGLEAIQRLRAMPDCTGTPIIALTALAMPGDRERCLEAGANEYMTKPVSLRQLAETIEQLIHT